MYRLPSSGQASADGPLVIGHRGAPRHAPGNTLASFEAAISHGAEMIELDVRRTRDGVLVVHHSATRRRTPVARLTYRELVRRCRHEPPTLEAVAKLSTGRVALDVEIKQRGCEEEVLEVLSRRFRANRLLITSFDDEVITVVKRVDPQVRCGLLFGPRRLRLRKRRVALGPLERARRCGAEVILPHQLLVPLRSTRGREPGLLAQAELERMPVLVWTVNGPQRLRRYLSDRRVAGIITDLPDVAAEIRRRLSSQRPKPAS